MKSLFDIFLSKSSLQARDYKREVRTLASLERRPCDVTNLRADLPDFTKSDLATEWETVQGELQRLGMGDKGGAVNPGDRRAIYYLARTLKPKAVLEVGTHLGASTSMFCLALKNAGVQSPQFTTVDILDVNGPGGAWNRLGYRQSPKAAMQALGCDFVNFVTSPSVPFMQQSQARFDVIFLDGGHEAVTVYQEVPAALKLLNPGGFILLHDFYPESRPLWSDGFVVAGPWLAIQRFKDEGAPITVKALGALPWPTKLNSNVTSLAVLLKSG